MCTFDDEVFRKGSEAKNMSVQHEVSQSDLYLNSQLIDKSVLAPKQQPEPGTPPGA